jgi:hypothetical protein
MLQLHGRSPPGPHWGTAPRVPDRPGLTHGPTGPRPRAHQHQGAQFAEWFDFLPFHFTGYVRYRRRCVSCVIKNNRTGAVLAVYFLW